MKQTADMKDSAQKFDMKRSAQRLAKYGWPVIALEPPVLGEKGTGKAPKIKNFTKRTKTTEAEIDRWWKEWPNANIGLVVGDAIGMWVLDVDPDKGGDKMLKILEFDHEPLDTVEVKTGSGGRHLYFKLPSDRIITNRTGKSAPVPGVEVKAQGGQVVLPPSMHFSGNRYEWKTNPAELEPSEAPEWLLDLVAPLDPKTPETSDTLPAKSFEPDDVRDPRAYARAALDRAVHEVGTAPEGGRNDTLNRSAFGMRDLIERGWIARDQVESELRDAALSISDHSFKPREIEKTLLSGLGDADGALLTDTEIEERKHASGPTFDPNSVKNPGAYARGVLKRAAETVRNAPDEEREAILKAECVKLQDFVSRGWIHRAKIEAELFVVAESTGLAAGIARSAIIQGLGETKEPEWITDPKLSKSADAKDGPDTGPLVPNNPVVWAERVLAFEFTDADGRITLARWDNRWWRFSPEDDRHQELDIEALENAVLATFERLYLPGKEGPTPLVPSITRISNTLKGLVARCRFLEKQAQPPIYFDGKPIDPMHTVDTRSGLFNLAFQDLEGKPVSGRKASFMPEAFRKGGHLNAIHMPEVSWMCLGWVSWIAFSLSRRHQAKIARCLGLSWIKALLRAFYSHPVLNKGGLIENGHVFRKAKIEIYPSLSKTPADSLTKSEAYPVSDKNPVPRRTRDTSKCRFESYTQCIPLSGNLKGMNDDDE